MAVILNCLNFGFCYDFNALHIQSVSKKYLDFANLKWPSKCTKIKKFLIKSCFYRLLAVKCHVCNSHSKQVIDDGEYFYIYYFFNFLKFFIQFWIYVRKFNFIPVLLKNFFCNGIIDIQCNAGVLSSIIYQKVNMKIWEGLTVKQEEEVI